MTKRKNVKKCIFIYSRNQFLVFLRADDSLNFLDCRSVMWCSVTKYGIDDWKVGISYMFPVNYLDFSVKSKQILQLVITSEDTIFIFTVYKMDF